MSADLSTATVVDAVVQAIRADISIGDYAPGTRLSEQDIAGRFSVARPTAKAAIERLVEVGLLRRTANKTAEIPVLSPDDIMDLYRFRDLIESGAAAALAAGRAVPGKALAVLRNADTALHPDDDFSRVTAEIAFQSALVDACGSRRLSRCHDVIACEMQLCMRQELRDETAPMAERHRSLLEAISRGDAETARRVVSTRLALISVRVAELARQGEPQSFPLGESRRTKE